MDKTPKIDIVMTGVIFAYDADTGDVLHINEIHEEIDVGPGAAYGKEKPSTKDCEMIREIAAADNPRCKVDVVAMTVKDMVETPSEGRVKFHVDPLTKTLRTVDASGEMDLV